MTLESVDPGSRSADPAARPIDGRRSRWTRHRALRRDAFVTAGVDAIDRCGPGTSAEQIAETAGVSRTVLYRYFRDREDLRTAIADRVVQSVLDIALPELEIGPGSTPRELVDAVVAAIVGWVDEHPNLYRFLRSRRDDSLGSVETTLADSIAGLLKVMMVFLGVDDADAEPRAHGIVGYVESTSSWWLDHRDVPRSRVTELASSGVRHLLEGVAREHGLVVGFDDPFPVGALNGADAVVSRSAVTA